MEVENPLPTGKGREGRRDLAKYRGVLGGMCGWEMAHG